MPATVTSLAIENMKLKSQLASINTIHSNDELIKNLQLQLLDKEKMIKQLENEHELISQLKSQLSLKDMEIKQLKKIQDEKDAGPSDPMKYFEAKYQSDKQKLEQDFQKNIGKMLQDEEDERRKVELSASITIIELVQAQDKINKLEKELAAEIASNGLIINQQRDELARMNAPANQSSSLSRDGPENKLENELETWQEELLKINHAKQVYVQSVIIPTDKLTTYVISLLGKLGCSLRTKTTKQCINNKNYGSCINQDCYYLHKWDKDGLIKILTELETIEFYESSYFIWQHKNLTKIIVFINNEEDFNILRTIMQTSIKELVTNI